MGRGDSRRTPKMRRRKSQSKLKARTKRKVDAAKQTKAPPSGAKPKKK